MAGIYHGHLLEFPTIRVDCFTPTPPDLLLPIPTHLQTPSPPSNPSTPSNPSPPHTHPNATPQTHIQAPNAQLFLLTHVHTDHLLGLSSSFTGHIICSPDTKRMLLRLEAEVGRRDYGSGLKEVVQRKYEGLKARWVDKGKKGERRVDYIEAVPYGFPREYEINYKNGTPEKATITLLDANHCPGSTMFLITSATRSVLHTGDIRADDLFLQTLRRNPAVQEYLVPWSNPGLPSGKSKGGRRTLDRIYLDTGAVLGTGDMPDREPVLRDLIDQMSLYPPDTIFFLNVWCFGWEDVVMEVARHFGELVHVDRYKASIYSAVKSDPFLSACTTFDPHATRFHACERQAKCEVCRKWNDKGKREWNLDKRIVHVNMVEIKGASWDTEKDEFLSKLGKAAIGEGDWPYNIRCPIARHSPLPELQNLVKMFRPLTLSPNTMAHQVRGLDYYLLPSLFGHCLHDSDTSQLVSERDEWFLRDPRFGRSYLDEQMRVAIEPVHLDSMGVNNWSSERDEYVPEEGEEVQLEGEGDGMRVLKYGKKAAVEEMVERVRNGEIGDMKRVIEGRGVVQVFGGFGIDQGGFEGRARVVRGGGGEDEDTDDERDRDRDMRRRKRVGVDNKGLTEMVKWEEREEQVKVENGAEGIVANSMLEKMKDTVGQAKLEMNESPERKEKHSIDVAERSKDKQGIEVRELKEESIKLESLAPSSQLKRKRKRLSTTPGFVPRFSVDRSHLAALAMVGELGNGD